MKHTASHTAEDPPHRRSEAFDQSPPEEGRIRTRSWKHFVRRGAGSHRPAAGVRRGAWLASHLLVFLGLLLQACGSGHERSLSLSSAAIESGEFQITLVDHDFNMDPLLRDSVTVRMTADKRNEPAHDVVLTETDANTGRFFGQALTLLSAAAALPEPGIINVVRGSTITVTHTPLSGAPLAESLRILSRGSLSVPASAAADGVISIEVYDPDVNDQGNLREALSVTVTVSCVPIVPPGVCPADASVRPAQAPEVVSLVESTPSSSLFTGVVRTFHQVGAAAPNAAAGDGAIDVRGASSACGPDIITFTYNDAVPAGVRTAQTLTSFMGSVSVSSTSIAALSGASVNVTVVDADLHDALSVTVSVASSKVDEPSESIVLAATALCSSTPTFLGSFSTSGVGLPVEGDSNVVVSPSDLLTITYADSAPLQSARTFVRVSTDATVAAGPTIQLRSAIGAGVSSAVVLEGSALHVTVTDLDLDVDPTQPDTGTVNASSPGDSQTVTVTETGASTGTFTGEIMTSSSGVASPGILAGAPEGALLQVTYQDVAAAGGVVPRQASGRVASTGAVSLSAASASFAPGDAVSITVTDPDLDEDAGVAESVQVFVRVLDTGDEELVSLNETALSSAVFTGVIGSTNNTGSHVGTLITGTPSALAGSVIEASYNDVSPPGGRVSRLKMCSTGTIDASPSYFEAGVDSIAITVTDSDLNSDPLQRNQVQVSVSSTASDSEAVVLYETGVDSAIFTGSIPTASGAIASDGKLQAATERDTVSIVYNDACPSQARTPSVAPMSAIAAVLTTGTSLVVPGDTVVISVVDSVLNVNAGADEVHSSLITASVAGSSPNSVTVPLRETGLDTNTFTGDLITSSSPGGGTLHLASVSGTDSLPITIAFADPLQRVQSRQFLVLATDRVGVVVVGQTMADAGRFQISSPISVTVSDADLARQGSSTTSVQLSKTGTADSEPLTLTQTSSLSGVYTGTIPTSSSAGLISDGTVNSVAVGDSVTATYTDTEGSVRTASALGGNAGKIAVSNAEGGVLTVNTGSLAVTVTDPDLNRVSTVSELYVQGVVIYRRGITNLPVVVTETAINSGVFTGIVNFQQTGSLSLCTTRIDASCVVSRLEPSPQGATTPALLWNRALLEYSDPEVTSGGRVRGDAANRRQILLAPGQDASISVSPSILVAGSWLHIAVTDQDRSADENVAEALTVTVSSSKAGELVQNVTCVETALQSRVFTGMLRSYNDPVANAATVGFMHLSDGDQVTVRYADFPRYNLGPSVLVAQTSTVVGWFSCIAGVFTGSSCSGTTDTVTCGDGGLCGASIGVLRPGVRVGGPSLERSSVLVGEKLPVMIEDHDANRNVSQVETVVVHAECLDLADMEEVLLMETGLSTGVFTGLLITLDATVVSQNFAVSGAGQDFDGTLLVRVGAQISLQYDDVIPIMGVSQVLTVQAAAAGSVGITPVYAAVGEPVVVQVTDADHNLDPLSADTIREGLVSVSCLGDSESISLIETGISSGIFTASLNTSQSAGTSGDRVLNNASPGVAITVVYDDNTPVEGVARTGSAAFGVVGVLSLGNVLFQGLASVTLIDPDGAAAAAPAGLAVSLSAESPDGILRDTLSVPLLQLPGAAGTFEAHFQLSDASTGGGAGVLHNVVPGTVVKADYGDLSPVTSISVSAVVSPSNAGQLFTSPTAELQAGTALMVTLSDSDLNLNVLLIDSAHVRALSSDTGEGVEDVLLTETTPSSGLFTGSLRTRVSFNSLAEDGSMNIVAGQTVTVEYTDAAPSSTLTRSVLITASRSGVLLVRPSSIGQGGVLHITVEDADEDRDGDTLQSAAVQVEVREEDPTGGPGALATAITFHLHETNADSGKFTGALQTVAGAPGPVELLVLPRQSIAVTYTDGAPDSFVRLVTNVEESTAGTIETGPVGTQVTYDAAAGLSLRTITAGDIVAVTVTDADLNKDEQAPDHASVIFITTRDAATPTVALTETSANSGIFTGDLLTRLTSGSGSDEASNAIAVLDVRHGDKLTGVYIDDAPFAERTGGNIVRVATPGVIQVSPSSARPGFVFSVTLTDADLDTNGLALETHDVVASSSRSGEGTQTITLHETSATSGIFTGLLHTHDSVSLGISETGYMNVLEGDILTVSYTDSLPSGHSASASALMTMSPCGCASIQVSPRKISAGASLSILVSDPDRNLDSNNVESISVRVTNTDRPAQVYVELLLLETSTQSGIFTASLSTVDNVFQDVFFTGPKTSINLSPGESLHVSYTNVGELGPIERSALVDVKIVGTLAADPSILLAGQSTRVVVDDEDSDTDPTVADTVEVLVRSVTRGASEPDKVLTLLETGPHTGIFEALLYTRESEVPAPLEEFKTVHVSPAERISLTYIDLLPIEQDITAFITVAEAGKILVSPIPVREDSIVLVTVIDADANIRLGAEDSTSVTAASSSGNSTSVTLTENGPDSSIFTGFLRIYTSDAGPLAGVGEGSLANVHFRDILSFSYVDTYPSGTIGLETQVLDSARAEVLVPEACPIGGRLEITVVDADMNGRMPDEIQVVASSDSESVTVLLAKPTPLAVHFVGSVLTRDLDGGVPANPAVEDMPVLPVRLGSSVIIIYSDPAPFSTVNASSNVVVSTAGSLVASSDRISAGGGLLITVTDADLDMTASMPDQAIVLASGERGSSQVHLMETGDSTGEFTGFLATELWGACSIDPWGCSTWLTSDTTTSSASPSEPAAIQVSPGEMLSLVYDDRAPISSVPLTITACTLGFLKVHPLAAAVGWDVAIRMRDVDLSGEGAINVTASGSGDVELAYLAEVVGEPGTFTGVISTTLDIAHEAAMSGALYLPAKAIITVSYDDACPREPVTEFVLANILGSISLSASQLPRGGLLGVTVVDGQFNTPPRGSPDTIDTVSISCEGTGGDTGTVMLTETGTSTSTFTGSLSPGNIGSATYVSGDMGLDVLCTHSHISPPMIVQAAARILPSFTGDLSLSPSAGVKVGAGIFVALADEDMDQDRNAIETHASLVRLEGAPGSEIYLSMTETGPSTGVFTGQVPTYDAAETLVPPFPGMLGVLSGRPVTAYYNDEAPYSVRTAVIPAVRSYIGQLSINPSPVGVSGRPQVLVNDPDLNTDPDAVETSFVTVGVHSPGAGVGGGICDVTGTCFPATATVLLTEMALDAQFFTGVLVTRGVPDAEAMTPGLGSDTVNVMPGYTITLEYEDFSPAVMRTTSASVVASSVGVITLGDAPVSSGVPISVTVTDPDLNSDPMILQSMEVTFQAGPPDCELYPANPGCLVAGTLTLRQTELGSNVFTGQAIPFAGANGCFLTCVGIPTAEGEFISFFYQDAAPAGQRETSAKVVSVARLDVDLVGLGGSVVVTVSDGDLDLNALQADVGSVVISTASASRNVVINETGVSTGVFTGSILTTSSSSSSVTVLLDVVLGTVVTVSYFDADPGETRTATRTCRSSVQGIITLSSDKQKLGSVVLLGSTTSITLSDADLNLDPLRIDTGTVLASVTGAAMSQGLEALTMTETGFNSGVFTAQLRLTTGSINGGVNNGAFDVQEGSFVHFTYSDAYPDVDVVAELELASVGVMQVGPVPLTAGQPLNVTVIDADLNVSPAVIDVGTVTLSTSTDSEVLTVRETGLDTGVFTGSINTQLAVGSVAGTLTGMTEGSTVQGAYRDAIPDSTVFFCPLCNTITRVASTAVVTILPQLLDVDGVLSVTVVDRDANGDPSSPDVTQATVTQNYRSPFDSRVVILTETGVNTDTFTTQLQTSSIGGSFGLFAPQGARISAEYTDTHPVPTTQRTANSRIASIGVVTLSPSPLNPDGLLQVTVDDADLDTTDGPDTTAENSVVVFSQVDFWNPDGHALVLVETGSSTGIFVSQIQTRTQNGTQAGLTVDSAVSGTEIIATYTDAAPFGARTAIVKVATVAILTVLPATFELGTSIFVSVFDYDLSLDRAAIDTTVVEIVQTSTGGPPDSVNLTIVETGVDTGLFTGTQETSELGGPGLLAAPPGSDVVITYVDTAPTPQVINTVTRRVAIGGNLNVIAPVPSSTNPCIIVPSAEDCTTFSFSGFTIAVVDSDVVAGTVPLVTVYNSRGLEKEIVRNMQSTGVGSITYTGSLNVYPSKVEGVSNDGVLNLAQGDTVQVSYSDTAPAREVVSNHVIATIGRIVFLGSRIIVGSTDPIRVQLTDSAISGIVTISTSIGLDSETVNLTETGQDNTFMGSIATSPHILGASMVNNGILEVRNDETVTVRYTDSDPVHISGMAWSIDLIENRGVVFANVIISPNGVVTVTVADSDVTANPSQAYVTLTSASGDAKVLTLTENGTSTGFFVGSMSTSTRANRASNILGGATPASDITVTYLDCSDNFDVTKKVRISSSASVSFGTLSLQTSAGLPIFVTVTDTNLDLTANSESGVLTLVHDGNNDTEIVVITETGGSTATFTGSLQTVLAPGSSGDGKLNGCERGSQITVNYADTQTSATTTDSLTFLTMYGSISVQGVSDPFVAGEVLSVTVVDSDLNTDPFTVETFAGLVALTSSASGDSEAVALVENSRNSGIFTGAIQSRGSAGSSPVLANDGVLDTPAAAASGNVVLATYTDPTPAGAVPPDNCRTFEIAHPCSQAYLLAESDGQLVLSESANIAIGFPLKVTVLDGDVDQNSLAPEVTTVQVIGPSASFALPLTETGNSTGIFTGSLLTATTGVSVSPLMVLAKGDLVTLQYAEASPSRTLSRALTSQYRGDLSDTFNVLLLGGTLRITLVDKDLDTAPSLLETVSGILVTSGTTGQREAVTLTERDLTSGVFIGILRTKADTARGGDFTGLMHVTPGTMLTVSYEDAAPAATITRMVRVATVGVLSRTPLAAYVGGQLMVTVTDPDVDRDPWTAEVLAGGAVRVSVRSTSTDEALSLTETGLSTGVFTAAVTLTSGPNDPANSLLGPVEQGGYVWVRYRDEFPLDNFELRLPVFELGTIILNPSPSIDLARDTLSITVVDSDLNTDPLVPEVMGTDGLVSVVNGVPAIVDYEAVMMTETGPDTGTFTGSLLVSTFLGTTWDDGTLSPITDFQTITATYKDMAPSMSLTATTKPSNVGILVIKPTLIGSGVDLTITVTDADLSLDSQVAEETFASVRSDRVGEGSELVTLRENGVATAIFTGALPTIRSSAITAANDGKINIQPGTCDNSCSSCSTGGCQGFLTVEYNDVSPENTLRQYVSIGTVGTITGCVQGQPTTDFCTFDQGSITVTVRHPNFNTNPTIAEQYPSKVLATSEFFSHTTNQVVSVASISVPLRETGVNSQTFTGTVSTSTQAVGGQLQIYDESFVVRASTVVRVTLVDDTSGNPSANIRLKTSGMIAISDRDGSSTLRIGQPVRVTVTDGDMDYTRGSPDHVTATVRAGSSSSGIFDERTLVLTETADSSSVFTGQIETTVGMPRCDSKMIGVYSQQDAVITATYAELAPIGTLSASPPLTLAWPGALSITESITWVNSVINVNLVDRDLIGQTNPIISFTSTAGDTILSIQLTPTATGSETYAGTLTLGSPSPFAEPTGNMSNIITARYFDASHGVSRTATILLAPLGVVTIVAFPDRITEVKVTLADLSADTTDFVDTLSSGVSISTGVTGGTDTEVLTLVETGPSTATFTGAIPVQPATIPISGNNVLESRLGGTVTVTYTDLAPAGRVVTANRVLTCNGAISMPRSFTTGSPISFSVSDCDMSGSVSVDISLDGAFVRTLTLTVDSGPAGAGIGSVYKGTITTDTAAGCAQTVCGVSSSAGAGSVVSVTYADSAASVVASSTASTGGIVSASQTFNSVTSVNSMYKAGELVNLEVADRDADISASEVDTTAVVATTAAGDSETIQLTETGLTTGIFTGLLRTHASAPLVQEDGRISPVGPGTQIQIDYIDTAPAQTFTVTITGTEYQSVSIDSPVQPLAGAMVSVTVVDGDLNTNPSSVQSNVAGFVTVSSAADTEGVPLTETGVDSSTFTGEIVVSTTVSGNSDGVLFCVCQGLSVCSVSVTYTDPVWGPFTDTASATRAGTLAAASVTGGATGGASFFVVGEYLAVTVTDKDLDSNPALVDSTMVTVSPGSMSLPLLETGLSTGIFTGEIATFSSTFTHGRVPGGVGPLVGGDIVSFTYNDLSPFGHTAVGALTSEPRATVTSLPIPATHANTRAGAPGTPTNNAVDITVTDSTLAAATNTTTVLVYVLGTGLSPSPVSVTLTAAASGSGVYQGSVLTTETGEASKLVYADVLDWAYRVDYQQPGVSTDALPAVYRRRAQNATLDIVPIPMIRAGGLMQITVHDADMDADWTVADSVSVLVSSDKLHEATELVTLTETAVASGTFTGELPTVYSSRAGGANDGCINVVEGNSVRVSYSDVYSQLGTAVIVADSFTVGAPGVPGTVSIVDPNQGNQRSVIVSEEFPVNVMVNDTDSAALEGSIEVSCDGGTIISQPIANATALGGGIYTAVFPTTAASTSVTAGVVLGCSMGKEIRVSYEDALPYQAVHAFGVMNRPALLSASPQPIGMSQSLHVTVVDDDLNSDALAVEFGTVEVKSSRIGEGVETLTVTETGTNSGVFTGETRTTLSGLLSATNSGGLHVSEGDSLEITYKERALGSRVSDALRTHTETILVGRAASVTASEVLQAGGLILITVTDEDLPLTQASGSAVVVVTTSKDQERETVGLTQTGSGSSTFTGALETCTRCTATTGCADLCLQQPCPCPVGTCVMNCPSELQGPSDDGILYVEKGDLITITYKDPMPASEHVAFTHIARLGSLQVFPERFLVAGDSMEIVVLSNELNNDPNAAEEATAQVITTKINEPSKEVVLQEDDINSGRFTGSFETRVLPEPTTLTDPFMAVVEGDSLLVVFEDFNAALGGVQVTQTIIIAFAGSIKACAIECSDPASGRYGMALPGNTITIEVQDQDLTSSLADVTIPVHISPNPTADYEIVVLQYVSDGLFRATLQTTENSTDTNDGILTVTTGSVISFVYPDTVPRTERIAKVRVAMAGVVAASQNLLNGYPVLSIQLTDGDLNTNEGLRDAATVTVTSQRYTADGSAGVEVALLESEADSGFFLGSLNLLKSGAARSGGNDGVLRGLSGDILSVTYQDALPVGVRNVSLLLYFRGTVSMPVPALACNEGMTVTVVDADLDTNAAIPDVIQGAVTLSSNAPATATITVTETGITTGVFTARVFPRVTGVGHDASIEAEAGATSINVVLGGTLTATHVEGSDTFSVTSDVKIRGVLAIAAASSTTRPGKGILQIALTDYDLVAQSSVSVRVKPAFGDAVNILLTETSVGGTSFSGFVDVEAAPSPAPAGGIVLSDSEGLEVTYQDSEPESAVVAFIQAPQLRFMAPSPAQGFRFETAADCDFQIPFAATDLQSEDQRLPGANVYIVAIGHSIDGGPEIPGLFPGAALESSSPQLRYSTTFSWRPSVEQEGQTVETCFAVVEGHALVVPSTADNRRCMSVSVLKCRKCVAPGESLNSIATSIGGQWRMLWSANPTLLDPTTIKEGMPITTALKYSVKAGDSLASVAMRFGTTVKSLLGVNQALAADSTIQGGDTLCVVPDMTAYDFCPEPEKSSTWEPIEEQYVPPAYLDNPYNWEYITWEDPRGQPTKQRNPDYPQLPAQAVGQEPGYSL